LLLTPYFGDDRQDVACRSVSFRLKRSDRSAARSLDPRIAELHTLGFRCCERRFCPIRDQGALLFGERGEEVQDERIDVRAEVRDQEWTRIRLLTR
jgi:hypothetical protein